MGEYLPDGSHQSGYATVCWRCRRTATVNMQGQGQCEHCGADQNEQAPKLSDGYDGGFVSDALVEQLYASPAVEVVDEHVRERHREQPPVDNGDDGYATSGVGWPE